MSAVMIVALLLSVQDATAAQGTTHAAASTGARSTRVDAGALAAREAWDRNEASETLIGVLVGADHEVWRGLAVRAEVLALRVLQAHADAWLGGITLGTRMRLSDGRLRPLLDVAVGASHASRVVPVRGTRFNYLALIGGGVERRVGGVWLSVTGRWLHASNNGREGRHLNPDIQSLGALVSVGWEH
jgi:hypothetical protein